jgi:ABC-type multidrug transport system
MLELKGVERRFASGKGIGPVSFCVRQGEVCSVVGPNGAGKSTLFGILSMVSEEFTGSWSLDGRVGRQIPRGAIGYLPESTFLISSFTPRQFCSFDASMRDVPHTAALIEEHLAAFACKDFIDVPLGELSQGMAKRVALACAFLGEPRLVLLDEPLNAIDIQTTLILKDRIVSESERGCTLLISSHILDFLDEVSDRMLFLREGDIADDFDPRDGGAEGRYRELFL